MKDDGDHAWVNQEMESLVSSGKYMVSSVIFFTRQLAGTRNTLMTGTFLWGI